jgi:hypothetical protein
MNFVQFPILLRIKGFIEIQKRFGFIIPSVCKESHALQNNFPLMRKVLSAQKKYLFHSHYETEEEHFAGWIRNNSEKPGK